MTGKQLSKTLLVASRLQRSSCRLCSGEVKPSWHSATFARSSSTTASYYADEDVPIAPLVRLENARLGYPSQKLLTKPFHLSVQPPSTGGHALLGSNGSGKTLVSNALVSNGHHDFLHEGTFTTDSQYHTTAHVSFESHESLLAEGGTTYKVMGTGNLNKAAQFLVVRFGLYPLLHRDVDTLSTGEIRKVLLVRALSNRPRLLVLDNAFDGLDVASRRNLKDLVSKTLQGFRPDILVQGVNAKATAHTQVLMITHRVEELVDEIECVTYMDNELGLYTEARDGRAGKQLLAPSLGYDDREDSFVLDFTRNDPGLPSVEQIASWWQSDGGMNGKRMDSSTSPLIQTRDLSIRRGDATLLHGLNWTVQSGERWLIAGKNGSGKSTLSRLLAREEGGMKQGQLEVSTGGMRDGRREGVGWVSTELHLMLSRSNKTALDVLRGQGGNVPPAVANVVAKWFDLDDLLSCPFAELSQGQQKLVLIAAAIASRPKVLVLDEPCQGLDLANRQRMLGLVERLCQATDVSLIYITHHLEEMLPTVGHVLHLTKGEAVYNGTRQGYDPESIARVEENAS